jgi:hypothetical protein
MEIVNIKRLGVGEAAFPHRRSAVARARLELLGIDNLRATYEVALITACALAVDTQNGPAIFRPAVLLNGWAEKHVTCSIQCLNGRCERRVDVRLHTLPRDQPWSAHRLAPGLLGMWRRRICAYRPELA